MQIVVTASVRQWQCQCQFICTERTTETDAS